MHSGEVVPLTMTNGNNKWDRMAAEWFLLAEEIQTDVQGAVDCGCVGRLAKL